MTMGRKPKPEGMARHRDKPVHTWTEVLDVPFEGAPRMPARRANGDSWGSWDRAWWRAISRLPHCILWTAADWRYALDALEIAARFHEGGATSLAAELRIREMQLGTTWGSRKDLRIRYVDRLSAPAPIPGESDPQTVSQLDAYRELLG